GPVVVITGAVLSIWNAALATPVAVLPARSVQLLDVTVTAVPSPLVVLVCELLGKAAAHVASGPEMSASRLKPLMTSLLYQPLPLAGVVAPVVVITGAVLSILTGPTDA